MKFSDGATTYKQFLKRILNNPPQRRYLLEQWHSAKTMPNDEQRLANTFQTFINNVLYQPIRFHLLSDRFYLFQGTNLPIFFNWISLEDQNFLINSMAHRQTLFAKRNEFMNNQFDYSDYKYDYNVSVVWRQQIVRDFVWMVWAKQEEFLTTELIAAVQWILLEKKKGAGGGEETTTTTTFLKHIHSGLQRKCILEEVLCII